MGCAVPTGESALAVVSWAWRVRRPRRRAATHHVGRRHQARASVGHGDTWARAFESDRVGRPSLRHHRSQPRRRIAAAARALDQRAAGGGSASHTPGRCTRSTGAPAESCGSVRHTKACRGRLRHMKSSHASSTPATNGRVVVAFFGSEGLFAFDMKGRPACGSGISARSTPARSLTPSGSGASPARRWSTSRE